MMTVGPVWKSGDNGHAEGRAAVPGPVTTDARSRVTTGVRLSRWRERVVRSNTNATHAVTIATHSRDERAPG